MAYALDYIDVAQRIADFRAKHPEGSLQPANKDQPYKIEEISGQTYIVVVAAAYRTPDDDRPGIGMAYEIFPGKTNFTRGSELQNAETSAWGRAIVAAMAGDTKKGIASAEEVRNRKEEQNQAGPDGSKSAEYFSSIRDNIKKSTTIDQLDSVTKQILRIRGLLTPEHLSQLQVSWKDQNTKIKVSSAQYQISLVDNQDGYDKAMKAISASGLDEDTQADLVEELDRHLGAILAAP